MQSIGVGRGLSVRPEQHTHLCTTNGQMMTDDLPDRAGTDQQYFHEKPYFPEIHGQMSDRSRQAGAADWFF
jgi:hypothetical protein